MSPMRGDRIVLVVCIAGLAWTGACGERDAQAPAHTEAQSEQPLDWFTALKDEPIEVRRRTDAPIVKMLRKGPDDSPTAQMGGTVTIEFIAHFVAADGTRTEFDSSAKRGGPLVVPLHDAAAVIGLLRGLEGLRAGDVARIEIPPEMGYGEAGRGPIPPNAALEFEVWVREITTPAPTTP